LFDFLTGFSYRLKTMIDLTLLNHFKNTQFNFVPCVHETLADLDTPLSLYLKLAQGPYSYLLESAEGGERFGRYSIIGMPAQTRIEIYGNRLELWKENTRIETHENQADVFETLKHLMARYRVPSKQDLAQTLATQGYDARVLPRFMGGWVGYAGYDVITQIEPKLKAAAATQRDPLNIPDAIFLLSEELIVVDNLRGKINWIVYGDPNQAQIEQHVEHHFKTMLEKLRLGTDIPVARAQAAYPVSHLTSQAQFETAVVRAKDYLAAGDAMQVVLSQRMTQRFEGSPISLYRALRTLNPSPYMVYFDLNQFQMVGASPEILVRLETLDDQSSQVTVRPIAGTRPRGANAAEDEQLIAQLRNDPKEVAEHVMLIDLGRNDVGRIAQTGTVQVTEQLSVEKYSHVMHLVSNVIGKVKTALHPLDVFKATFPAGTLSGAPKIRAMEMIYELEPIKRSWYGGAMGYIGFHGDMDLAIAIRTGLIKEQTLHIQAGAGIVMDSDPSAEWQETLNKARSLLRASEAVSKGLDS